mgnify:CR=1 FL=1
MKRLLVIIIGLLPVAQDLAAEDRSPIDPITRCNRCALSGVMQMTPVSLMQDRGLLVAQLPLATLPRFQGAPKPTLTARFAVRAMPRGLQSLPFQDLHTYSWRREDAFNQVKDSHTLMGFVIGGGIAGSLGASIGGGIGAGLGAGVGSLTGGVLGLFYFTWSADDSLLLGSMIGLPLGITIGVVSTGGDSKSLALGLLGGAVGAAAGSSIGAAVPNMTQR